MSSPPFHQHVPRPATILRRPVTPWSALAPQLRAHVSLEVVARAFPGDDLQRPFLEPARAAVLVGLLELDGEAHILLTRRSSSLLRDPGLVSFPGGYIEAGERPLDAALREAHEEIGLESRFVDVRAALEIVERSRSALPIASFLGLVAPEASFVPSTDEVEALLMVPLRDLLADESSWQEEWGVGDAMRVVHFVSSRAAMGDNLVWGVTAKILWEVLVSVTEALAAG